jgi:TM2 domain-containing membrane protein YozV
MSVFSSPPDFPPPPPHSGSGGERKEKVVAGLLAIFFGALGIHKFYLGGREQKQAGLIQLLVCVVGVCFLFAGPFVAWVIGFIEGIIYLTKDDAEFNATYGYGDKAWF